MTAELMSIQPSGIRSLFKYAFQSFCDINVKVIFQAFVGKLFCLTVFLSSAFLLPFCKHCKWVNRKKLMAVKCVRTL